MEKKIFKWEAWDEIETGMFQFTDVELVCQVGQFAPKTKFEHAVLDYNKGTLTLGTGGY